MSFECGIPSRRGNKADEDGLAVKYLRDAGGIPLGVTNVPELCICFETHNLHYGRTMNPYDLGKTPGGSSGGEAALIGAGASPFGIGSDFMGSIRLPSAFTGIFGLRPTSPLVTIVGSIPYCEEETVRKMLSFGPMTRHSKDLPVLLRVLSGENAKLLSLDKSVDVTKLQVFHVPEFPPSPDFLKIDLEIEMAVNNAVNEFRRIGSNVQVLPKKFKMFNLFEKCMARIENLPRRPLIEWSDIPKEPNVRKGAQNELYRWIFGRSQHTFLSIATEYLIRTKGMIEPDVLKENQRLMDELEANLEVISFFTFKSSKILLY